MNRAAESFIRQCAATVGRPDLTVVVGAQNVALIGDREVWRFPRRDATQIHTVARRCTAAAESGLGAPEVLGIVGGPVGTAHIVLRRLPGTPLLTARRGSAAAGVLAALERLRRVREWEWTPHRWADLWGQLADVAERQGPSLSRPHDMVSAARRAAAVAQSAPVTLIHGDLASDNLLLRDDGGFAGLLDWDSAVLGDQAMDVAAVLHVLSPSDVAAIRSADPTVDDSLQRFAAYAATWPLQEELWRQGLMPLPVAGTEH